MTKVIKTSKNLPPQVQWHRNFKKNSATIEYSDEQWERVMEVHRASLSIHSSSSIKVAVPAKAKPKLSDEDEKALRKAQREERKLQKALAKNERELAQAMDDTRVASTSRVRKQTTKYNEDEL